MTDEILLQERRGSALWLRLNRPEVLNALSPALLDEIDRAFDLAEASADIRSVVVAATGRVFCSGADLKHVNAILGGDPPDAGVRDQQQVFLRRVGQTFDRIEAFPKPVIAAVHALAVAGGLELVLCCDFVVATRAARFGDAHANYGMVPGGGGTIRLPRRVGMARAKQLLFTGADEPAENFADTDLVNVLVDDDDAALIAAVDGMTESIAAKSPLGLRVMKQLVHDGMQVPLDVGLRMELHQCQLHEQSRDLREGVAAFNEKRAPDFTGR